MTSAKRVPEAVVETARRLIQSSLDGPIALDPGEILQQSDRNGIYRFVVRDGPPDAPRSMIAKQDDGDAVRNEWAGLAFLTEASPAEGFAPRVLGGDLATGIVVMEDIADGTSMDELLLGEDRVAAEAALLAFARTLGRMHAATAGRTDAYRAVRARLGLGSVDDDSMKVDLSVVLRTLADALGHPITPDVERDVACVAAVLDDPGPFAAYIHGDPCPDNCLRIDADGRVRIIDFEYGRIGHALLDGVYGRMHFPTCWCVGALPGGLPERMEATYRAELAVGCPAARDDRLFDRAVADACAAWYLIGLQMTPLARMLDEDGEWGTATVRQRMVLRGEIVAQTLAEADHLSAFGSFVDGVTAELHARWDATTPPMPLYPAFR